MASIIPILLDADATKTPENCPVSCPAHYNQGDVEAIDAISAALGRPGFTEYCRGQVLKYVWRMLLKGNPLQDAKKAQYYMNRIVINLIG